MRNFMAQHCSEAIFVLTNWQNARVDEDLAPTPNQDIVSIEQETIDKPQALKRGEERCNKPRQNKSISIPIINNNMHPPIRPNNLNLRNQPLQNPIDHLRQRMIIRQYPATRLRQNLPITLFPYFELRRMRNAIESPAARQFNHLGIVEIHAGKPEAD